MFERLRYYPKYPLHPHEVRLVSCAKNLHRIGSELVEASKSGSIQCMMHDDPSAGKTAPKSPIVPAPPTDSTNLFGASNESVMRDAPVTKEDVHRHAVAIRDRSATLKAMVITSAIVIAPFLALVFGLAFAMGVLAAGLAFTTIVTLSGARRVNTGLRPKLYVAAALNGVLFLVIVVVLLVKLSA